MEVIKPTVGRIVLVHNRSSNGEPLPGIITKVWGDTCVNVVIFANDMKAVPATFVSSCHLVQPGAPTPVDGTYATWIPFQVGQAAMTQKIAEKAGIDVNDKSRGE